MKRYLLIFCFFITSISFAQKIITGRILFENEPMPDVSVYLNGTTQGTTTNDQGEFSLQVEDGKYQLIISYLGFETIEYALDTNTYNRLLQFVLKEKTNMLDEIVVGKTNYDNKWRQNLNKFKRNLLGDSRFAMNCKIINEKDLFFENYKESKGFSAISRKPLIIENKSLGYKITFDLVEFSLKNNFFRYKGYTKFEELKGNTRKQKKWNKNREKAYNGSFTHFLNCLVNNKVEEEGFTISQTNKRKKTDRPTKQEVDAAIDIIYKSEPRLAILNIDLKNPKNPKDLAYLLARKLRIDKIVDSLYNLPLNEKALKFNKNGNTYLNIPWILTVTYNKEKEEYEYYSVRKEQRKHQTSILKPIKMPSLINQNFKLVSPFDVSFEGYWIFERLSHTLPLDYIPNKTQN